MKRFVTTCLLMVMAQAALASPMVIYDPCTGDPLCSLYTAPGNPLYHGGNGGSLNPAGDIIGPEELFDTLKMTVSVSGPTLMVSILTRFIPDANYPNMAYGDLLLSTTGWHPSGAAPYDQDTATTSTTDWNYVIATQTGTIYQNATLANSDTLTQDADFRHDQYVAYASGGMNVGNAFVDITNPVLQNIFDGATDTQGSQLTYSIQLADLGLSTTIPTEVALRWTTTGANDIVEAAVTLNGSVPEPASLALFLAGLAVWRQRREPAGAG